MTRITKVWCTEGILVCKDVELKFTEPVIILQSPNDQVFIPYGSLSFAHCKKDKGRSSIKLYKHYKGEQEGAYDVFQMEE